MKLARRRGRRRSPPPPEMVLGFERADLYTAPIILGNMPLVVPPNAVLRQPEFLRQRGVTGTRGQKEIEPPTIRMPTCSALAIRPYRPPRRTPPHRSLPHQVSTTPALAKAFTRAVATARGVDASAPAGFACHTADRRSPDRNHVRNPSSVEFLHESAPRVCDAE